MNKTEAKYFNCVKNDNVKIDAACLPGLEEEKVAKIFWYIHTIKIKWNINNSSP